MREYHDLSRRACLRLLAGGSLGLLAAACAPSPSATIPPAATPTSAAPPIATSAPAATAPPAAAAPTSAGAATTGKPPAKRDSLVVGIPRPIFESNDMIRGWDGVLYPMYEALLGVDPQTGAFVPELAERWQIDNGKDYHFFLRQGIPFHNGMGELSADDVKLSYDRITDPGQSNNAIAQELRDIIDHVEVLNPYEVLFVNKVPDATLLMFTSETLATGIVSKKDLDARGGQWPGLADLETPPLAGTGPWQLTSRTQNQNIVFERVPYKHWRIDPEFQQFELRFQSDVSQRLNALLSHEISLTALTRDLRNTAVQKGMQLFRGARANIGVFVTFMGSYLNDPFGDASAGYKYPESPIMNLQVRKALSKALDRKQLNQLFLNEGQPMYLKYHMQEVDGAGWNPDWQTNFASEYDYDPDAARQLLAGAGFDSSNPLKITIELAGTIGGAPLPEQGDLLEAVNQMWQSVGVQSNLETMDVAEFTARQRALGFDDHAYLAAAGQPQNWVFQRVMTARRQNRGVGFENYEFEAAYYDFIHTLDPTQHDQRWRQVGDLDYQLHMAILLFWLYQEYVGDPGVIAAFTYPGTSATPYFMLCTAQAAAA